MKAFLSTLILMVGLVVSAEATDDIQYVDLAFKVRTIQRFPSMTTESSISVSPARLPTTGVKGPISDADLSNAANWKLITKDGAKLQVTNAVRMNTEAIDRINLHLKRQHILKKGQEVGVQFTFGGQTYQHGTPKVDAAPDQPAKDAKPIYVKVDWTDETSFEVTPNYVEKAELIDGKSTSAIRTDVEYSVPYFSLGDMNGYLRSKSVISTNHLDKAGRLQLVAGAERILVLGGDPVYMFIESGVVGNQALTNASFVSTLGLRKAVRLLSLGSPSDGPVSRVPYVDFGVQYADWYRRDDRVDTPRDEQNTLRLSSGLVWKPWYFMKALAGKNQENAPSWALEFEAHGWYFPDARGRSGLSVSSFESVLSAALIIPIKLTKDRTYDVKISYLTGAQESNNFTRTSALGFSVNLAK